MSFFAKTVRIQILNWSGIQMVLLTNWFIRNNVDGTKYVYEYSVTVYLQVQTITSRSKPFQSESLYKCAMTLHEWIGTGKKY